ncbi:MAG: AraC family transcriptional regulator [Prevotella sp.]|nr:AraC family transcriptional regulator [Prevotella sp.]
MKKKSTEYNITHALKDDVLVISNIREVNNLSTIRMAYNTIVLCQKGKIVVEVGGSNQVKALPNQLLLIPAGKMVQPMLMSADAVASALLISDRTLKMLLGNQINIWNKAMYMKEIYVLPDAEWINGMQVYMSSVFDGNSMPILSQEIIYSFLRTVMLMICEKLLQLADMMTVSDTSTIHDKEVFNLFLQLVSKQEKKRQRVSFYANQLHITSKHLSTISKRVSGKSPLRWITESVMQDGYRFLIETDLSVKEISNRLGFPNSSFFGQYFREQAGVTPISYRTEHKKGL